MDIFYVCFFVVYFLFFFYFSFLVFASFVLIDSSHFLIVCLFSFFSMCVRVCIVLLLLLFICFCSCTFSCVLFVCLFWFFFFLSFSFIILWLHCPACRLLVPSSRVGPEPPGWECWVQDARPPEYSWTQGILISICTPWGILINPKTRPHTTGCRLRCWTPHNKQPAR